MAIFGYTKPLERELKVKEQQCYKAYYCGVCREIGRNFGQIPRFGLTHEFAVLAMLLSVCTGEDAMPNIRVKPCIAHPFRKVISYDGNPYITYAAACNVLFFRAKMQDAWHDERRLTALLGSAFFAIGNKKAVRKYKTFADLICSQIKELTKLEETGCSSVDKIAEPFARLLAILFSVDGLLPSEISGELQLMGYHLGKWIYLVDAATDRIHDRETNNYNVYNIRYGTAPLPENESCTRELCLAAACESWERLKNKVQSSRVCELGYLDNLFYLGLRAIEARLQSTEQEGSL